MARSSILWALALALTLAFAVLASTVGPGDFSIAELLEVYRGGGSPQARGILWELRTPRVALALAVGAALGAAGALTQGLFRNPLASPGVLALPTGSALAVVLGFALGLDAEALWVTPLLAFVGASGFLLLLFGVAGRRRDSSFLLLAGVALGALGGAAISCTLAFNLDKWDLSRRAMAWLLGSFDGRGWSHLSWSGPPILLGLMLAVALHRGLDLLFLGEDTAASLGVRQSRFRWLTAGTIALLVGAATAAVGALVFVGLIVPHVARWLVGPLHLRLIPASALLGGWLVLAIDTVGRALSPTFLAPGALTGLLGGTFFLVLLARHRGEAL